MNSVQLLVAQYLKAHDRKTLLALSKLPFLSFHQNQDLMEYVVDVVHGGSDGRGTLQNVTSGKPVPFLTSTLCPQLHTDAFFMKKYYNTFSHQ